VELPSKGRLGRFVLSGALLLILASLLVWNLPECALRRALLPWARPLVVGLGLQQSWAVFSPNPARSSVLLEVRVDFEDGSSEWTTLPGSDPFLGALRDYRWRKWVRRVTRQERQHLWNAAVSWFARRHAGGGRAVQAVVLTRRVSVAPARDGGAARDWRRFEFFEWTRRLPPGAP
jgi:hypothetical protein